MDEWRQFCVIVIGQGESERYCRALFGQHSSTHRLCLHWWKIQHFSAACSSNQLNDFLASDLLRGP